MMIRNGSAPVLCRAFNAAVLHVTGRLLPRGFDVSPSAPGTWPDLQAHFRRTGRIAVWDGASESSVYGDSEVNYAFRAWHDCAHLRGGYDFTPEGETAAAELQCRDVLSLYPGETGARFCQIIWAEVCGQSAHLQRFGAFPADQFRFVHNYLTHGPEVALAFAH